jgi:hypothetical protein
MLIDRLTSFECNKALALKTAVPGHFECYGGYYVSDMRTPGPRLVLVEACHSSFLADLPPVR